MSTVYDINKGINRSIEFKGIRAQYIAYLAVSLVALLLLFAIIYVIGINIYACLGIVIPSGAGLFIVVQRLSKKYGEHGLVKRAAQRKLPPFIQSRSRNIFIQLSEKDYEKGQTTRRNIAHLQN
ncbi:MAG: DUF4133 domain-containing protein [Sphingobacteriales bacterium]|mgnify:CR=1 FL=1|nr:DUF4133 domain-containing protein [Sphingobacteriales bacterium]OJW00269.1 MAG: hypothetical protein BGO52_04055 [Sphingobacteriales bacterium 44-61]